MNHISDLIYVSLASMLVVKFVGGRFSCTGAEVSIDLKDAESSSAVPELSVQPHEGPAPENTEDLVHCRWCLDHLWSESSIQHRY